MKLQKHSIIGNREVEGPRTHHLHQPCHRAEIGTVSAIVADGVEQAVATAKEAFPGWAATPVEERAEDPSAVAGDLH